MRLSKAMKETLKFIQDTTDPPTIMPLWLPTNKTQDALLKRKLVYKHGRYIKLTKEGKKCLNANTQSTQASTMSTENI